MTQETNISDLGTHNKNEIYYCKVSINISDDQINQVINIPLHDSKRYNHYDYTIDKYDINIIVNENNTLDITENIAAFFKTSKHGIYRSIPIKNTFIDKNGQERKYIARISNINVNEQFNVEKETINGKKYKIIKIGKKYMIKNH